MAGERVLQRWPAHRETVRQTQTGVSSDRWDIFEAGVDVRKNESFTGQKLSGHWIRGQREVGSDLDRSAQT